MRIRPIFLASLCLILGFAGNLPAQQSPASSAANNAAASLVPRLIKFSGTLLDQQGRPMEGPVGVTFALYAQQAGGAALWMETQNVELDARGDYTTLLGAASAQGVPAELFNTGEARWLGVLANLPSEAELPRILLVSVPYALKAGDAQTLGGLPPSAFAPANSAASPLTLVSPNFAAGAAPGIGSANSGSPLTTACSTITADGTATANLVAKFTAACQVHQSLLFDNGTNVGIGNGSTAPAAKLDVFGTGMFRGALTLPSISTATSTTKSFNSQPFDLLASVFNGTAAVGQHFRWQAETVNPGLSTASGKLNLLFASSTGTPAETGFSFSNKGIISFASGQAFPGTGTITGVTPGPGLAGGGTTGNVTLGLLNTCAKGQVLAWNGTTWVCATGTGTITAVNAGTGLSGGGNSGVVTLNLASNACAAGHALTALPFTCTAFATTGANTFTGNQMVTGNISDTGNLSVTGTLTGTSAILSANNTTNVLGVVQSGTGAGIGVNAASASGDGIDVLAGTGRGILVSMKGAGTGIAINNLFAGSGINVVTTTGLGIGISTVGAGQGLNVIATTSGSGIGVSTSSGDGITVNTSTGTAVFGQTNSNTNFPEAIHGIALGDADFVAGVKGGAKGATTETVGVLGFSMSSIGIGELGQAIGPANVTTNLLAVPTGLWGDTSGPGTGVLATADTGDAIEGFNDSNTVPTVVADNFTTSATGVALRTFGQSFGGQCDIDVNGNLKCTGTKSAVVPVDGGARKVALYAVEATENWFEDAGSAQLSNGSVIVTLEPTFAQTVNTGMDYHVFLTPNGDCKGLFVAQKTSTSFVVRELGGGTSNIAFDYRIMARRRAFENIRLADETEQFQNVSSSAKRESTPLDAHKRMKPYQARP